MLLMVLMIASLVMVLGVGFLSSNSPRYNASVYARASAQARALAEAGQEDARVKLQKDASFPPISSASQSTYSYRQTLTDDSGNLIGSYVVTVDWTYLVAPYFIITVHSQGLVGANPAEPLGNCILHARYDMHPIDAAVAHPRDANYGRIIQYWEDSQ